ncbi:hypothetical protein OG598_08000 [Micromonospora sp. NBC_00330]|uniref:hypothetical protein n=1 Tax=Micromonospora sp. NBC_00330 TaxID=2903585 RepID=UPI002E2BAF4B|nr:hypothetical protein [Micromonospora sp. NBC_00330]
MNRWEIIVGVILGLLVNEMTDLSPWAARRLARWAAYRWATDPEVAAGYAEEWTAIVDERPGKLFKLLTAVQFSLGAARRAAPRTFAVVGHAAERRLESLLDGLGIVLFTTIGLSLAMLFGLSAGLLGGALDIDPRIVMAVILPPALPVGPAFLLWYRKRLRAGSPK